MYTNQSTCPCQQPTQCGNVAPAPCGNVAPVPCGSPQQCQNPNLGPNCSRVENVDLATGQTYNVAYDTQGTMQNLTTSNYYNNYYRKFNHYYVTDYKYNTNYYAEYNVYHRTPVNMTNGNYCLGTQNIVCTEGGANGGCGSTPIPCGNTNNTCGGSYINSGCTVTSRQCF
ncbi:MAG: hypothetical protein ACRDDX_03000 [Cellulosilyticaceae bacterium]